MIVFLTCYQNPGKGSGLSGNTNNSNNRSLSVTPPPVKPVVQPVAKPEPKVFILAVKFIGNVVFLMYRICTIAWGLEPRLSISLKPPSLP